MFGIFQNLGRIVSMISRATASQCLGVLGVACAVVVFDLPYGHAAKAKFSQQAWREAVDLQSSDWSREDLLSQLYKQYKLKGMKREMVLELLENPAVSSELYPGSKQRERTDIYRLSAKNTKSFRIEYDAPDRVTGSPLIDFRPCKAKLFIGPAPEADKFLTMAVLRKSLLEKYTLKQITKMTVKEVETLLGNADKGWEDSPFGGEREVNYLWRLSADGRRVFVVNARVPSRTRETYAWEMPAARIRSYAIVSMGPDCLPDIAVE